MRALSATALGGCGLFDGDPEPAPPPDPLQPVLDEALALVAAYDRAVLAEPGLAKRLVPLAADHRTHAAELSRVIGKARQRRSEDSRGPANPLARARAPAPIHRAAPQRAHRNWL